MRCSSSLCRSSLRISRKKRRGPWRWRKSRSAAITVPVMQHSYLQGFLVLLCARYACRHRGIGADNRLITSWQYCSSRWCNYDIENDVNQSRPRLQLSRSTVARVVILSVPCGQTPHSLSGSGSLSKQVGSVRVFFAKTGEGQSLPVTLAVVASTSTDLGHDLAARLLKDFLHEHSAKVFPQL